MLLDITIAVNPNLNVRRSHDIAEKIEQNVLDINSHAIAFVHIEPYDPKGVIITEEDYHF